MGLKYCGSRRVNASHNKISVTFGMTVMHILCPPRGVSMQSAFVLLMTDVVACSVVNIASFNVMHLENNYKCLSLHTALH